MIKYRHLKNILCLLCKQFTSLYYKAYIILNLINMFIFFKTTFYFKVKKKLVKNEYYIFLSIKSGEKNVIYT